MSFVTSMALRARLVALSPLVLVARLANRKSTLVARHECLPVLLQTYLVSTYLTDFGFLPVFVRLNPTIMLSFHDTKNVRLTTKTPFYISMHALAYILEDIRRKKEMLPRRSHARRGGHGSRWRGRPWREIRQEGMSWDGWEEVRFFASNKYPYLI